MADENINYQNTVTNSFADIHDAMQRDWLYVLSGGALTGARGKQIQAQLNQENEFDLEAAMMNYENWYNSPSHQIDLMNEAGIGIGQVTPNQSASADIPSVNPGSSDLPGVLGTTMNIVTTLSQAYQFITSAAAKANETRQAAFNLTEDSADTILGQILPYSSDDEGKTSNKTMLKAALKTASGKVGEFMQSMPSGKHRRYLKRRIESLYNTDYHKELQASQAKRAKGAKYDLIGLEADVRHQGTDEEIFDLYNALSKLYIESYQASLKSNKESSEYDSEFYSNKDASAEAKASDFDSGLKSTIENFIDDAEKTLENSDVKPWVKTVGKVLVYFLASRMVGGSASYSSGPKGSSFSFGF